MNTKRTSGRTLMCCAGGAVLAATAVSVLAGSIELTVVERSGVARQREPVTSGVPFPKGEVRSADQVRLLRDGQEVPAQFRAVGWWRPKDSIRWLLVDFQTDLAANARRTYTLEYGSGVLAKAKPATGVRIEESDNGYAVDTGAARFEINTRAFDLFREVRLADGSIIVPRHSTTELRVGAVLRGLQPMVTRAIPDPANQGRSHLIFVTNSPLAGLEDYTLRFTSPREFELTGSESGSVGHGAYLKDFTSKDGFVSIPASAWLNYAYPAQGDVYRFRTIPAGYAAVSEHVREVTVLERGPMRSVIRLKGSFGPANAPVLEFTVWYHFYAGSGRVKLAFTLENNHHGGRTPDGNARNADIGGINCVFFDAMNLRLPVTLGSSGRLSVGGSAATRPLTSPFKARTELYQDSSSGEHWNRYQAAEFHPRPNSYVSFKGYRIFTGEAEVAAGLPAAPESQSAAQAGDRALGWLDVSDATKGVSVSVADFWQNYPKALSAEADGTIEVGLFPGRYAADFPLRSGEHKTHEVLFFFHAGAASEDGNQAVARAFSDPLRLEPSPQWFAKTRALGDLHPFDQANYPAYEVRNLSAIGVFPEGAPPSPSLLSRREENEFYGWMDYGDVPIDFEAPSGQWGMKYDFDYVMAQQWARTLNPKWWGLFVAADRHTRDIDIHHQPHYPGLHFVNGGVWAHSTHGEPGHKNPHRNRNHFTKDLCFGARGTAALYYLTGDWKAHDACLEIAENALAEYMSPQRDPGSSAGNNRMGWRGDGCTLHRLLEGYLLSGDAKFLERARWQIKSCAFDGKPPKHEPISLWSSLFYMEALARFVEAFPDDAPARSYLLAYAETLRKSIQPENGIYYTITPRPDGSVTGNGDCSHYNIMAADILSFAYRLTSRAEFLDAARRCFAYGVKNANGRNSTPTYYQVHSANGAMHGNVFMVVDSTSRRTGSTSAPAMTPASIRGVAQLEKRRPKNFPHRIWAACDFEGRTPDYAWFGPAETNNIPRYPGNATALGVSARPYQNFSALMTGINPVPGPCMGKVNQLYLRYLLRGATEATFQHFSLTSEDNNHIRVSGLTEGQWSEVTLNFTRDGHRNDGTPGVPFKEGERMDDLKIFVGKPGDGKRYELFIDDVIFFASDPDLPPEPEPFPNRIIFLAAFDTGATAKEIPKYWPGEFEMATRDLPAGSYWNAARAVPQKNTKGKWIRLQIAPPRPVGAHTKLRFRYHLTGGSQMTVQMFDLTDQDNRHVRLRGLKAGAWQTAYLDFTRDARRNDGRDTPLTAGHLVDDLFFFVQPAGDGQVDLLVDEVVLFDAGKL